MSWKKKLQISGIEKLGCDLLKLNYNPYNFDSEFLGNSYINVVVKYYLLHIIYLFKWARFALNFTIFK